MKINKFIFFITILLFLIFLIIFSSSRTNYYEYSNNKKAVYTEEKIKEFEKDIEEGKNVNIKDYITYDEKDYSNNLTKFADSLSKNIFEFANVVLNVLYKIIIKIIG